MKFKAVKFRKDGYYSAPFVFGGEEGMENYDIKERYTDEDLVIFEFNKKE